MIDTKCREPSRSPYSSFTIYHSSFFIAAAAAFFGRSGDIGFSTHPIKSMFLPSQQHYLQTMRRLKEKGGVLHLTRKVVTLLTEPYSNTKTQQPISRIVYHKERNL